MIGARLNKVGLFMVLTTMALSGCSEQSSPQAILLAAAGTHECAGRSVVIEARYADIRLDGRCLVVTVRGAGNTISIKSAGTVLIDGSSNVLTIDAADSITVNGAGNQVTYAQALSKARPSVLAVGDNNELVQLR
jgi:hypothetical protein